MPVSTATPSTTAPRSPAVLRRMLSLHDFEDAARRRLPRPIFGYIAGAAEDNASLRDNRAAFGDFAFVTRVLRDVSQRSQSVELFGERYSSPFGIAPMGINALSTYRGALVVERAGFRPLVATVDIPVSANRENNIRTGFSPPLRPSLRLAWDGLVRPRWVAGTFLRTLLRHGMPHFENSFATRGAPIVSSTVLRDFSARDHLSWRHIEAIRRRWKGPLVVKGLLSVEDALQAQHAGADGVVLSNHGGRQLDGAISPMRVLEDVVAAVGPSYPVLVGRPFNYAAAVAGEAGVLHAITLLRDEVDRNLAMLGATGCSELGPQHIARQRS